MSQEEATSSAAIEAMKGFEGASDLIEAFVRELAERLNPEIVPLGVVLAVTLLGHDMHMGISGFSRPLPTKLLGHREDTIRALERIAIHCTHEFFPKDFADEITREYQASVAG